MPAMIRLGGRVHAVELCVLDCDGVIFDVNAQKTSAFGQALAAYPSDAREAFLARHRAEGGVSRYDKLRWFFTALHPVAAVEEAVLGAAARFAAIAESAYAELAPREEALAFIAHFGAARAHVVSGADQDELRRIFRRKGLERHVAAVWGSPEDKRSHVERLLRERAIAASAALFVGDGGGDFETARACGIPFVYLAEMSEWREGRARVACSSDCYLAESWRELLSWL